MKLRRSRNYCFTWNNPPLDAQVLLKALPKVKYLTFGEEVAPATGTPHLQGFISFETQKSFSAARKLLKGCHVEICRDVPGSIKYCHKDGTFIEVGDRPSPVNSVKGNVAGSFELILELMGFRSWTREHLVIP